MANAPFEIIAAPFTVYLAPVGEAFTDVSAAPAAGWVKLGTSGDKNYAEDGVKFHHEQSVSLVHTLGRTGPAKAFRDKEGLKISLTLLDLTLEQYRRALNDVSVTAIAQAAGVASGKSIPLSRGLDVAQYALLIKGDVSPEGDGFSMQYQVPVAFVNGNPEAVYKKGVPAGLAFEFTALEDPNADAGQEFGKLVVQSGDPA